MGFSSSFHCTRKSPKYTLVSPIKTKVSYPNRRNVLTRDSRAKEDGAFCPLEGVQIARESNVQAFRLLGDLLKGSGWTAALTDADIASSGTADSFLSASNVLKTRKVHQVTAASLFSLMKTAFDESEDPILDEAEELTVFLQWCDDQEKIPQFQFWYTILKLELLILCFVRSYRESDFKLYKESLSELIPYFFALDHINYARWLPVHLRDMIGLETAHPDIHSEFCKGNFAFHKTERVFSGIAIDQAHEQNNAIVKGDGGAIGLTEDPSALRRWMIAGPEISRIIDEFADAAGQSQLKRNKRHHDDTIAAQKDFHDKVQRLKCTLSEYGSPFEEDSQDLYSLDTKEVADKQVSESMTKLLPTGRKQYDKFLKKMTNAGDESFHHPLAKNKLPLFGRKVKPQPTSGKLKVQSLKNDCQLFSRLFISCQSRQCDLECFFQHENQHYPPSLSQNGMLNTGVKSQLMEILETGIAAQDEPDTDVMIIDGAAMVNAKPLGTAKTFDVYATEVIISYIERSAQKCRRVDVVFDVYLESSLKAETRQKRGAGVRRNVVGNNKVPKSWTHFLRCDENKTELFGFLAERILNAQTDSIVVVTKGNDAACNKELDISMLAPSNHEEADTRMFVHAKHATVVTGYQIMTVVTSDTDVAVIAISVFTDIQVNSLWLAFGKGQHFRWLPIHDITKSIGPRSRALPFFHAFTGCDTVSAIVGKGKKSAWQAWNVYEAATKVFCRLSSPLNEIAEGDMEILEQFVVVMYDRSSTTCRVDECRLDLFARRQRPYNGIPPTRAALHEHVKRAALQAGHVWGQSCIPVQQLPDPTSWGWLKHNKSWAPHWTTLSAIAECCQELQKCNCKRSTCTGNCKCFRTGLSCTALCSCNCQVGN